MATIDTLVQDFLAQKIIAVVRVSDTRETGANLNYETFKHHGYRVYPVNPRISTKVNPMITTPASTITKAASKQTYYTIHFLVDRERVDDAYRAYAYFRWVDDTLDAEVASGSERSTFIERQKSLLERCFRGQVPRD